jgi:hypothetical protein
MAIPLIARSFFSRKYVGGLRKAILKRDKVRRDNINRDKFLAKQLNEREKRRIREENVEKISNLKSKEPGNNKKGGALKNTLEILAKLLIGWMINNLPKIIEFIEGIITRIRTFINGIQTFFENMFKWIRGFGGLIMANIQNFLSFDFNDQSGRVKKSVTEMEEAFEGMQKGFDDAINAFTADIKDLENGGSGTGGGGNLNSADIEADTPEEKAFIATVRELEGTGGPGGYNTVYGGAVVSGLTEMTLAELYDASKLGGTDRLPARLGGGVIPYYKDKYNSSASGAPQLMPETLRGLVNTGRFSWDDKFSPETQNKIILSLAIQRGVNPSKELNENDMQILGGEWASLTPQYGQTTRTASQSLSVYRENLREARGEGGSGGRYNSSGGGNVVEYLTGDRTYGSSAYRADHDGDNYHDHIAFRTIQDKERAKSALRAAGIQIGSEYRAGSRGWHGANLAIDIPGAQWGGSGAIGKTEFNGSARVRKVLFEAGFSGAQLGSPSMASIAKMAGKVPDIGYSTGPKNTIIVVEEESPPMMMPNSDSKSTVILAKTSLNSTIKRLLFTALSYT